MSDNEIQQVSAPTAEQAAEPRHTRKPRNRKTPQEREPGVDEDVFDIAIAARQAEAAQVVQSVATATEMPENGRAAQHAPHTNGHATGVKKREYKPLKDPFGSHLIALSNDPKGPKARLLRSQEHQDTWIQFSQNPGKGFTKQLADAGFHWEPRAHSDFAKGAWVIDLEPGKEWRNHAHAEEVFREIVNQIREQNGMEPHLPMAAQSR